MSSAYEKLRRILALEKEQGCRNRAVIGGLSRFLSYWEKEARQEAERLAHPVPVDSIVGKLTDYAESDSAIRCQAIDQLLALLAETDSAAASAPMPAARAVAPVEPARVAETPAPWPDVGPPPTRPAPLPEPRPTKKLTLSASVTALKGVSTITQKRLARLGVNTIRDLLHHFPRRYDDYGRLKPINRLALNDEVTVVGVVQDVKTQRTKSGKTIIRVKLSDGTAAIEATWYNQRYLEESIKIGREIALSGKVDEYLGRLVFKSPEWEPLRRELLHTGRLVPVYPLVAGIHARWLRRLVKNTLDEWVAHIADPLPQAVLDSTHLVDVRTAISQIHFPKNPALLEQARRRLSFDEFLLIQLGVLRRRHLWQSETGRPIQVPRERVSDFIESLPFALTSAQQRAIADILADLEGPVLMSRLLQGDVGSGKTVVAVVAALAVVHSGLQVAIMAPTAVLAEQHYRTVSHLLARYTEINCDLLVGSLPAAEKQRIQEGIASGDTHLVIGTHALIQEAVEFSDLGLIVVDEQHRFGVAQRGALRAKSAGAMPHLLAMSATPIPRTLALTLYGDLDISLLDEMPPNRQQIVTAVRDRHSRERIYAFISGQVAQGRQAYVICPLVEESESIDTKAAVTEHRRLEQEIFPHLRLGLLHGRMSADDKDQVMSDFKDGRLDILISTAVVEVGIDVPNASVMLIEGAERFGLAQLHQFRGRVGRGEHKSYCILLSDDPSEQGVERLRIMESTADGFVLAEKDLEMRGPGEFFGVRQHGLPELRVAKLSDTGILEMARREALKLFEQDPDLSLPEHRDLSASVRHFWTTPEVS